MMCKRGANPDSLERLESTQVPAWSCILTASPLIPSWHWLLDWFMSPSAKLLEILPFLHFQCLGPQWEWSTAMAVGQLDACSQLLPTTHWRCQVSGSTGQVHAMDTWSSQRPVRHTGVALRAIAQVLWVHSYKVGYTMANESAGRGWPEPAHHLRSTSNRNPRPTGLFPAAAGGMALSQLQEESDRQEPQSLSFARCGKTSKTASGFRAFSFKTGIHQCNSTVQRMLQWGAVAMVREIIFKHQLFINIKSLQSFLKLD